jgi:hypothetical protein
VRDGKALESCYSGVVIRSRVVVDKDLTDLEFITVARGRRERNEL